MGPSLGNMGACDGRNFSYRWRNIVANRVEKISIAVPSEMAGILRSAVKSGEFASNSEVVRDALREWTRRRERRKAYVAHLRGLVREADSDPRPWLNERQMSKVIGGLRRKYQPNLRSGKKLKTA